MADLLEILAAQNEQLECDNQLLAIEISERGKIIARLESQNRLLRASLVEKTGKQIPALFLPKPNEEKPIE